MRSVSVLIPTLNAEKWLPRQLEAIQKQTVGVAEIVLIDSESEDDTLSIAARCPLCRVLHVKREAFDHGGTRDWAARTCESDCLWFMTQDAIPADENCLRALLDAVKDADVVCAYGRQMAEQGAPPIETLNRLENYPEHSFTRSEKDIGPLQVRAFFLSNTCCLYKRDEYLRLGGFQNGVPTNEDMLFAARALQSGLRTAYCADARVWHTHRATLAGWYHRSFDVGAFMEMYGEQLCGVSAAGAGKKYALAILGRLLRAGRIVSAIRFCAVCFFRLMGDRDGHRYRRFSERAVLKRGQNGAFWRRYFARERAEEQQKKGR